MHNLFTTRASRANRLLLLTFWLALAAGLLLAAVALTVERGPWIPATLSAIAFAVAHHAFEELALVEIKPLT